MIEAATYLALAILFQRSARSGAFWMILTRLPSTILHELSHLVMALLLSATPKGFSLWPKKQGDSWVLGSVSCSGILWWNAFPVSMAPAFINLPIAWWLHGQPGISFKVAAFVFLVGSIPSLQDLKVSLSNMVGAALWLALIVGAISHRSTILSLAKEIIAASQ